MVKTVDDIAAVCCLCVKHAWEGRGQGRTSSET